MLSIPALLPDDQLLSGDNSGNIDITLTPTTQPDGSIDYLLKADLPLATTTPTSNTNALQIDTNGKFFVEPSSGGGTVLVDGTTITGVGTPAYPFKVENPYYEKAIFSATNNAAIVGNQSTTPITTGWTQSVNIGGGSFSAGAYTIPLDGVYSVTFYARFATADWPAKAEATATIRLNGTAIAAASNIYPAAITADAHNTGTAVIVRNFVAGDVITTSIWQEGGANRTLSTNIYNHFIVERIF